jgi:hypothetical protein
MVLLKLDLCGQLANLDLEIDAVKNEEWRKYEVNTTYKINFVDSNQDQRSCFQ